MQNSKATKFVTGISIAFFTLAAPSFAKVQKSKGIHGKLFFTTPANLLEKPTDLKPHDQFYREMFGELDPQIENMYVSGWRYHEEQMKYSATSYRQQHYNFASTNFDTGPSEDTVRNGFATTVFRMRIDKGIRNYLRTLTPPGFVRKTQQALDQVKSMPIALSNEPGSKAGQLQVGYDVLTDASKLEYVGGWVEGGIYNSALTGSLFGDKSGAEMTSVSLRSNIGGTAPQAAISVPLTANTFQASLSKSLSASVSTQLVSTQPMPHKAAESSYQWQLAYNF